MIPGTTNSGVISMVFEKLRLDGPPRKVVIVTFGAQPKPTGKEPIDPLVFFDAVAAALD